MTAARCQACSRNAPTVPSRCRLSGATVVRPGTANHCDVFHLRGALSERTAALVDLSDVLPTLAELRDFDSINRELDLQQAEGERVQIPLVDSDPDPRDPEHD